MQSNRTIIVCIETECGRSIAIEIKHRISFLYKKAFENNATTTTTITTTKKK